MKHGDFIVMFGITHGARSSRIAFFGSEDLEMESFVFPVPHLEESLISLRAGLRFCSVIELDDGKIYRKALYLMVKPMVSCRFSLKPIQ